MIINQTPAFILFENTGKELYSDMDSPYPLKLYGHKEKSSIFKKNSGLFGFISSGNSRVKFDNGCEFSLKKGMYFSYSGNLEIQGGEGFVIEVANHKPLTMIGGPLEKQGRLKYIDGCSDSLLLPPVKLGDPCFNHLHFPPNTIQTMHTHPSIRIGAVYSGSGNCITPFGEMKLVKNKIFVIKPNYDGNKETANDGKKYFVGSHKFDTQNDSMDIVAFHPDSDFGPQDENHPMINRTIVEGVSAVNIKSIHTQKI